MVREITMGRYLPGSSVLHRADPRTKIALTLLFMSAVFLVRSLPALLTLLILNLLLAHGAGKKSWRSLSGLRLILYLALTAVAANLAFVKGTPLSDHGLLRHISREAVDISARMVLRLLLLAGAASLLTQTTTPFALTSGVERLLKPLNRIGVPVSDIAMMMLIALRFIPVIIEEAESLIKARSARGGDCDGGNPLRRIGSLLPLFIPLFAGVARRGDALATAMEARCFRGSAARSSMRSLEFSGADLACVAAMLAVLSLLLGVESLAAGRN